MILPKIVQGGGKIGQGSMDEQVRGIQYGIDIGIDFIDTSEIYPWGQNQDGLSETYIGKAIQGRNVKIATKVAPQNLKPNDVIDSCKRSLVRLGVDKIFLYQIHWPNPRYPLDETLGAMLDLQSDGLIEHIGVCNFSEKLLHLANVYTSGKIASLQTEYNLLERSVESHMNYLDDYKIGLMAYSPLDQGNLKPSKVLLDVGNDYNKTPQQIALNFLVRQGATPIVMSSNPQHILDNYNAVNFTMEESAYEQIDIAYDDFYTLKTVPASLVNVVPDGRDMRSVYTTVDDARKNILGLTPSPMDLVSQVILEGNFKPFKVRKSKHNDYAYDLISGRVRYWANVIAYGYNHKITVNVVEA